LKVCLLAVLFILFANPYSAKAELIVEVIPVYNRPASEIQPLLMPLLETADQIVANGDNIILKTTPERLQTVTNIIRKLDNQLSNLQITVIQSREVTADQLNAGLDMDLNIPSSNPADARGSVVGYFNEFQGRSNNQNRQTIRTLDGAPAQIKVGRSVPVSTYQSYRDSYGYPNKNRSIQYIEATTGFQVTPRLVGQQVTLEVSPWSDRFDSSGQIQTQEANTTLRANLGEWVEIGAVEENGQSSGSGASSLNQQSVQNKLRILVKVNLVN
jgi:type II secretory pathway component GspD/PulD (secretin)